MIICGETFAREPRVFPTTQADRLENFTANPFPEDHIDYWLRGRVAVMFHEMHHALVPRSKLTSFIGPHS